MTGTLLSLFMGADYTPAGRTELLEALAKFERKENPVRQDLTFNCFEFTFDAESDTITIYDVLDGSETGSQLLTPEELRAALDEARRPPGRCP